MGLRLVPINVCVCAYKHINPQPPLCLICVLTWQDIAVAISLLLGQRQWQGLDRIEWHRLERERGREETGRESGGRDGGEREREGGREGEGEGERESTDIPRLPLTPSLLELADILIFSA